MNRNGFLSTQMCIVIAVPQLEKCNLRDISISVLYGVFSYKGNQKLNLMRVFSDFTKDNV